MGYHNYPNAILGAVIGTLGGTLVYHVSGDNTHMDALGPYYLEFLVGRCAIIFIFTMITLNVFSNTLKHFFNK